MDSVQEITNELLGKLGGWWESTVLMLPNFAMAILILVVFVFAARISRKGAKKVLQKTSDNRAINNLISTIIYVAIIVIGLFFALGALNLEKTVTSLLAGVGVIGLALGFAFQNTASNFISGILMASKYPMRVDDLVDSNGHFGKIEAIGLRYTTMRSFQGQVIVIPNNQILEQSLTNYSITGERRVDLDCGVSYGDDLDLVEKTAIDAITKLYESEKPVEIMFNEFGDSSINFTLRFWLKDITHKDYLKAKSDAVRALKRAFDEKDINIPFPIRTLEFKPSQLNKVLENTVNLNKNQSSN